MCPSYDHPLKKQEVVLVDHNTFIKLVLWQEHCDKLEDQKTQGDQQTLLSEYPKVRAVSLQGDSSFYTKRATGHYRDGVTNTEQNISQINWHPNHVKKSFVCVT